MVLEGLLNFVEVRDFLYSRMRGAKHPEVPAAAASGPESLAGVLGEVASEIRALRHTLEHRGTSRDLRP
jgi:hypothetical protein